MWPPAWEYPTSSLGNFQSATRVSFASELTPPSLLALVVSVLGVSWASKRTGHHRKPQNAARCLTSDILDYSLGGVGFLIRAGKVVRYHTVDLAYSSDDWGTFSPRKSSRGRTVWYPGNDIMLVAAAGNFDALECPLRLTKRRSIRVNFDACDVRCFPIDGRRKRPSGGRPARDLISQNSMGSGRSCGAVEARRH